MRLLEICVDTPAGLEEAIKGGADRIELCSALALGGLTPSAGLMALAAKAPVPVLAMIRPRAGGFDWSEVEVQAMEAEIHAARQAGLAGVVIGATVTRGESVTLDEATLDRLLQAAKGLDVTLHRCIDLVDDPLQAIDTAAALGIPRILTSGGALTALEGLDSLRRMKTHAGGRLTILPGSGISPATLPQILEKLDPAEVHASASLPDPATGPLAAFGFQPKGAKRTDAATVAALKALLQAG